MTPSARVAAAIEILDHILSGTPPEPALSQWARSHRFAGSGDRAAIRDHVFDALRCQRSFAALGGALTGRGLMIGALRAQGRDPAEVFNGERYAPEQLSAAEQVYEPSELPETVALNIPDWLAPHLRTSLGAQFAPVLQRMQARAPVFLRVNTLKADLKTAHATLVTDGIETEPHSLADTALRVTANARRVSGSAAYRAGLVELQDAASQAVVAQLAPIAADSRVLDYCAGGGGKSLALAAMAPEATVLAHDALPRRMVDLPARAKRAGARIRTVSTSEAAQQAPYDLVLCDVPCSGSGAWRRQPAAKWDLTPARLEELCRIQSDILSQAARLVAPGGRLAYATCSLLEAENTEQIEHFVAQNGSWRSDLTKQLTPLDGGDGFFLAILKRE